MATMVIDDDSPPPRAPNAGGGKTPRRENTAAKDNETPSQASAAKVKKETPGKRPRGRPRKPKNNTIDTAIVLSDSDDEEDDTLAQVTNKRALSRVESPMPAPRSKRPAQGGAGSSVPTSAALAAAQAEIEELHAQLAAESRRRAELETQKATLRTLLQEKEASWADDLAAQTMPLQLQVQRLAKDKENLRGTCKDLDEKLMLATKDKEDQCAAQKAVADNQEDMIAMKEQLRAKNELIKDQVATIQQLRGIAASRLADLGEADERIATLTETMQGFATRHAAAAKLIKQHEARIESLTEALERSNNSPGATDKAHVETAEQVGDVGHQALDGTSDLRQLFSASQTAGQKAERQLTATQARLSQTEQNVSTAEGQFTLLGANDALIAKENDEMCGNMGPENNMETIASMEHIMGDLEVERATLQHHVKELTIKVAHLEQTITGLQADKAQHEQQQLQGGDHLVSASQHKSAAATTGVEEMDALMEELEQKTTTSTVSDKKSRLSASADPAKVHPAAAGQLCDSQLTAMAALQAEKQHLFQKYQDAVTQTDDLRGQLAKVTLDLEAKDKEVAQLNDRLEKGKEQWRTDIAIFVTKLRDQTQMVETKERQVEKLQKELEAVKAEASQVETEMATHRTKMHQRNAVITQRGNAIEGHMAKMEELRVSPSSATTDKSTAHEQLMSAKRPIQDLEGNLTDLTARNDNLYEQSRTWKVKMAELAARLAAVDKERDALTTSLGASKTEAAFLRAQLAGLTHSDAIFSKVPNPVAPANHPAHDHGYFGHPGSPASCPPLASPMMVQPRPSSQPLPSRPPTPNNFAPTIGLSPRSALFLPSLPNRSPIHHPHSTHSAAHHVSPHPSLSPPSHPLAPSPPENTPTLLQQLTDLRTENTNLRRSHDTLANRLAALQDDNGEATNRLARFRAESARLGDGANAQRAEVARLMGRLGEARARVEQVEGELRVEREGSERVRRWVGEFPGWREMKGE